jgi:DNA-binding CsgD family transcriptional regulator
MAAQEAVLELIYDGITDDSAWTAALAMIASAAGASGAGLGVQDMKTHEFWSVAPALHQTYQRLAPENRIWQAIGRSRKPMADHMVVSKPELVRSALYSEWFAPQDFHSVMAAPVMTNGSHCGVVVTFGSKQRGEFDETDLGHLAGLARHLSRALALRLDRMRLMDELQVRNRCLDEVSEGVLLLDGKFHVRHANGAAQVVLDRRDGLFLRNGCLACRDARDNSDLQRALLLNMLPDASPSGGWIVAHRRDRRPLLIRVTKLEGADLKHLVGSAALMVRIEDPDPPRLPTPELLRKLLDVTLGEAKVMLAVASTDTQEQAAAQLGVAKTTVRTQLHHAYQKLGIHDRAELLRLLAIYGFRPTEDAR